tara:strand:+ start:97954 stop:98484 length:531 start_codon:yes stop_codon:yes gene_type:complete
VNTNESDINKPNFQLPDNYFEQFGEELQAQIALEKALGGKVSSGFSTPDAYFENRTWQHLPLSNTAVQDTREKSSKVISIFSRKTLWTGLSIAAIAIIVISLLNPITDPTSFDTLDLADIENYMNNEDLAFTTDELADLLSEDALNTLTENTAILNDEQLIDYLEESTDMYQISIE